MEWQERSGWSQPQVLAVVLALKGRGSGAGSGAGPGAGVHTLNDRVLTAGGHR